MVQPPSAKRRSPWLVAVAAIVALVLVATLVAVIVTFTWLDVSLGDGIGSRTYAPASAADVRREYKLGVGNMELDLKRVSAGMHIEAHVGIGKLRILLPDGHSSVDARAKAGSVSVLGRDDSGRNAHVRVANGNTLFVTARVGAGDIEVEGGE